MTSNEADWGKEHHYTPASVRRQIQEGNLKVGRRRWQIPADQTKPKGEWFYSPTGVRVFIPPIPPPNFIWDRRKNRFVPVEKYAKEHSGRVVVRSGRKLYDPSTEPGFEEALSRMLREQLQRGE